MTVVWVMLVAGLFAVGVLGWSIVVRPPAEPATIVSIAVNAFMAGVAAGVLTFGKD